MNTLPSLEKLKNRYLDAGDSLVFKPRPLSDFTEARLHKAWNTRWAGKKANHRDKNGYLTIRLDGVSFKVHRLLWKMREGSDPDGHIDHINQVPDDNRHENLRVVTNQENSKNQKRNRNNKSGVTGVVTCPKTEKFIAQICVDGKCKHLGTFTDKIDAIYARYYAEQDYGFHENHGRAV